MAAMSATVAAGANGSPCSPSQHRATSVSASRRVRFGAAASVIVGRLEEAADIPAERAVKLGLTSPRAVLGVADPWR